MKKILKIVLAVAILAVIAFFLHRKINPGSRTTSPVFTNLSRTISGNQLNSSRDPTRVLRFDPSYQYVGGQKFVLYGVANAEQHFFVEASPDKRIRSLYWVQFEEYLPENSYRYDYSESPERMKINDLDFYLDTEAYHSDPRKRKKGSDGSLARQFVQSKGFIYPDDFFYARMVHLTDASRRKELMIIFIEDLSPAGFHAADLMKGGTAADRWPEIKSRYLEKIRATLSVQN